MKNKGLLVTIGVILILVVLNHLPDENKRVSSTPPVSTTQKSSYITVAQLNEIRRAEITADANNNLILLGFRLKMSPTEYRTRKRALVRSGQLQPWDEQNYYVSLFSVDEMIQDKHFGQYTIPNYARVELRHEPVFIDGKLVSWELPVWFDLADDSPNSRSSNNLKNIVDYLSNLYGDPLQQDDSRYYWINGNLEIVVSIKTVPKPPYGSEAIPVIFYRDNSYYLNK